MNEQDYLFYTYTGSWSNGLIRTSQQFPYSLLVHPATKRLVNNGVVYGDGSYSDFGPFFIKGLNNSNDGSGAWVGRYNGITKYKEGLSIIFLPTSIGSTTQTTLEINGFGARKCYFTNNNPLTQQYSIGTPILLTYVGTANDGYWKRADQDTTKTPVKNGDSSTPYYYFNLTGVTSGLTDILTFGSQIWYDYGNQTMHCPNFAGQFTGNVVGKAESADKLYTSRNLWGQPFNGTADVTGSLSNTGNITRKEDNNKYSIGTSLYKYYNVWGDYFKGRANGVRSYSLLNPTSAGEGNVDKIYILGCNSNSWNIEEDSSNPSKNKGGVFATNYIYITKENLLHSAKLTVGSNFNSSLSSPYVFCCYGLAQFQNNVEITSGGNLIVRNGKIAVNTNTPTEHVTVNGNVVANRYYTNISDETLSAIGSVYVTNSSSDNAIRKISFTEFVSISSGTNAVEISKNLRVTIDWMDTGIITDTTTIPSGNGSYIVQIDATSITDSADGSPSIYSGVMSIYETSNVAGETEEIILHRSSQGTAKRLYLRTMSTANGANKLQIAASNQFSKAYNLKFRFKKIV